jgi:hypothetical protein
MTKEANTKADAEAIAKWLKKTKLLYASHMHIQIQTTLNTHLRLADGEDLQK